MCLWVAELPWSEAVDHLVEIRKQSSLEEAQEPELVPKERHLDGFEVDWRAWSDWSWHQAVWGRWLERAKSSSNWTGNYGGLLFAVRRFWRRRRGLCLARQVLGRFKSSSDIRASHPMLILIYLLTVNGLTPAGSSTVHIYTQTIHRTTQWIRIHRTVYNNNT